LISGENRATLLLSRRQVAVWFKKQPGAKTTASNERPSLTAAQVEERKVWIQKYHSILSDPSAAVAFLDEKWMYTSNRRRRMKILPHLEGVDQGPPKKYRRPKAQSRRFPIKTMFLGCAANPQMDGNKNFDGRICLYRISEKRPALRISRNQRFSPDVHVNRAIQEGEWRDLFVEGMTAGELIETVADMYDLEDDVKSHLELSFKSYKTDRKTRDTIALHEDTVLDEVGRNRRLEDGQTLPVTFDDIDLNVVIRKGEMVEEDCSCDGKFMKKIIPKVAEDLRTAFHWVPETEKIYLVMDNAGGHGSEEVKNEYVALLAAKNIEVVWQVPNSPETNMLDLGLWMSIQAAVQKVHWGRRSEPSALVQSVNEAWDNYLNVESFKNVFARLKVVLQCIADDNGGNDKVEAKRGKLTQDATVLDLTGIVDENGHDVFGPLPQDIEPDDD
jgi:hypothetical protein